MIETSQANVLSLKTSSSLPQVKTKINLLYPTEESGTGRSVRGRDGIPVDERKEDTTSTTKEMGNLKKKRRFDYLWPYERGVKRERENNGVVSGDVFDKKENLEMTISGIFSICLQLLLKGPL